MLRRNLTVLATLAAVVLGLGWAAREWVHAAEQADLIKSQTRTAADVKVQEALYEGKPTGKVALYFEGQTAGTRDFVTGRFVLDPGKEPHTPHTHLEEEILIVTAGAGEIECDGKTTPVGPGAVMYTAPNVRHGIRNTSKEPLVFYFVKWTGVGARK